LNKAFAALLASAFLTTGIAMAAATPKPAAHHTMAPHHATPKPKPTMHSSMMHSSHSHTATPKPKPKPTHKP